MAESKQELLKGAHYCEEGTGADHAHAVLLPLQGQNGFVFSVSHALGTKESFDFFASILQNHLERLAQSIEPKANLTHRFEQLLQALNEDVARGADEGQFSLPINDAGSVIGVASGGVVVLSGFGNLLSQFMHKSQKEQYDIYDLTRGMRVEEEAPSWKKAYLTVLDGELKTGDVLYIGTRASRHDLPVTTLNEVITTLPPSGAVNRLRQYLPIETVFAAVVIKSEKGETPSFISERTAEASIKKLDRSAAQTDRLLSDQKPEAKSIAMKLWLLIFPKRGSADRRKLAKQVARLCWRLGLMTVVIAGKMLLGLAVGALHLLKQFTTNPKRAFGAVKGIGQRADRTIRRGIERFNGLPRTSKYALLGLLVIGSLFLGGIILINRQQTHTAERRAYETSVKAVKTKIDNASASLIYGDEEQARGLLNEAWQLADTLSTNNKDRQTKAESLKNQIEEKRDELRHLVTVTPVVVADASGMTDTTLATIIPFNNKWYGMTSSGDAYAIDPGTQTLLKLEVSKGEVGAPRAVTTSENAIYWLDDAGLTRYLPESGEIIPLSVSRKGVDLSYYGGKMYILSPETGQVYKHVKTTNGFDGGSAWIISGVSSVSNGVAMTIDGFVWILKADGSIVRYLAGKETDWKAGVVEPSLLNAKAIWTSDSSTMLYVLDANEKRVVVFDKDKGTLITQYQSEQFTDLKSMIVDEVSKKISVLAGNKVLQFEMK